MRFLYVLLVSALFASPGLASDLMSGLVNETLEQNLSSILNECGTVLVDDLVACPEIHKYSYPPGATLEQIGRLLYQSELAYRPEPANAAEAIRLLTARIERYQNLLETQNADLRLQRYSESTSKIIAALEAMATQNGNFVLVDWNTYWAPSVNASAAFVIDPSKSTIHVFIIGDTDG